MQSNALCTVRKVFSEEILVDALTKEKNMAHEDSSVNERLAKDLFISNVYMHYSIQKGDLLLP